MDCQQTGSTIIAAQDKVLPDWTQYALPRTTRICDVGTAVGLIDKSICVALLAPDTRTTENGQRRTQTGQRPTNTRPSETSHHCTVSTSVISIAVDSNCRITSVHFKLFSCAAQAATDLTKGHVASFDGIRPSNCWECAFPRSMTPSNQAPREAPIELDRQMPPALVPAPDLMEQETTLPNDAGDAYRARHTSNPSTSSAVDSAMAYPSPHQQKIHRRTLLKLDYILLPFLSFLFLLNHLDKSNVGNAEAAHFTEDLGLPSSALNKSVACFWAVFVAVQPLGAALGRKYGMARWVPTCMALWGLCTALHIVVRHEWQLIALRGLVAIFEAGFYPTTVSYLSLFYTRYEFAKRLGIFYGQSALAGAVGGLLSWAVFQRFPDQPAHTKIPTGTLDGSVAPRAWKSWEILFLIEGSLTIIFALIGFFWLPHNAESAWFFTPEEGEYAEARIRQDRNEASLYHAHAKFRYEDDDVDRAHTDDPDREDDRLLSEFTTAETRRGKSSILSTASATADSGLSRLDILAAVLDWKIWYLLVCNILSAVPTTAFAVFLPLVIRGLTDGDEGMAPARANLLAIPPFLAGALTLWTFTWYSDRTHKRFLPTLYGLALLLAGLTTTIMLPSTAYVARYIALTVLLSGSFVASPLTIAWLTNNIPEPGKRAMVLGINGWGNLAGVFSAMLFSPKYEKSGYIVPFYVTTACVLLAFVGYIGFKTYLIAENRRRDQIITGWSNAEIEREALLGDMPLPVRSNRVWEWARHTRALVWFLEWAHFDGTRIGEEKLTFKFGL